MQQTIISLSCNGKIHNIAAVRTFIELINNTQAQSLFCLELVDRERVTNDVVHDLQTSLPFDRDHITDVLHNLD